MTEKRTSLEYDLGLVKSLVSSGRVSLTKKGTSWLRNHGYSPRKAIEFVLSLDENEYVETLLPDREGGLLADVYRCRYSDDEIDGEFYVKFLIESQSLVAVVLSSKEWGYGWWAFRRFALSAEGR